MRNFTAGRNNFQWLSRSGVYYVVSIWASVQHVRKRILMILNVFVFRFIIMVFIELNTSTAYVSVLTVGRSHRVEHISVYFWNIQYIYIYIYIYIYKCQIHHTKPIKLTSQCVIINVIVICYYNLLFAGIIRSSPFSPRQQDKG